MSDIAIKHFTEAGECTDEVKLVFEDGQTLYVSQNMLSLASPVFKAMFAHNFKEKEEREVKLTGKNYKDVLEFLLCLHPAVQQKIGPNNILQVVGLAEEYQVGLLINRCKFLLPKCLDAEVKFVKNKSINDKILRQRAANCLAILHKALECRYSDIVDYAITSVSKFGYGVFSGTLKLLKSGVNVDDVNSYRNYSLPSRENYIQYDEEEHEEHEDDVGGEKNTEAEGEGGEGEGEENDEGEKGVSECRKLYSKLPDDIKYKLLVERLIACDKNTML